jgi:hypothetical protein
MRTRLGPDFLSTPTQRPVRPLWTTLFGCLERSALFDCLWPLGPSILLDLLDESVFRGFQNTASLVRVWLRMMGRSPFLVPNS